MVTGRSRAGETRQRRHEGNARGANRDRNVLARWGMGLADDTKDEAKVDTRDEAKEGECGEAKQCGGGEDLFAVPLSAMH